MSNQIFWPKDLLMPFLPNQNIDITTQFVNHFVLGAKSNARTFVVAATISDDDLARTDIQSNVADNGEIKVIGILNRRAAVHLRPASSDKNLLEDLLEFRVVNGMLTCDGCTILLYQPPDLYHMEFFSLQPISISLFPSSSCLSFPSSDEEHTPPMTQLVKLHDNEKFSNNRDLLALDPVIHEINQCWRIRKNLLQNYPSMKRTWSNPTISFKQLPGVIYKQASSLLMIQYLNRFLITPLLFVLFHISLQIRQMLLIMIAILNCRIFSPSTPNLIEISAAAQQLDLRLRQLVHLPIQYFKTAHKSHHNLPCTEKNPEYIRLYNTLWLILNDIMIGYTVGWSLIENCEAIVKFFTETVFMDLLYHDLNDISIWLMNSPGGIKLNNELSAFLSDLFRWIVEFWRIALIQPVLTPFANNLILFFGLCCSVGGLTLGISLLVDAIHIVTFHLYCFYYAIARIYHWCLDILLSLFYLFYGRKRNVLRNRVDFMEYELDEILLGILLFTVLVFLLPTVTAFYLCFTLAQVMIFFIIGMMEVTMSLLNHSPIFVILLRLKEPKRIPNGIEFQMNHQFKHVELLSTPLTFMNMFSSFFNIIRSLPKSYFSHTRGSGFNEKYGLLIGLPVIMKRNKFYSLLYKSLPTEPVGNETLLREFEQYQGYS